MKTFSEWLSLRETVANPQVAWVLKTWDNPQYQQQVAHYLKGIAHWLGRDNHDWFEIESLTALRDILPQLKRVPAYRSAAEEIEMLAMTLPQPAQA